MKTFTFATTKRLKAMEVVDKFVTEGKAFSFAKKIRESHTWYLIKIRLADVGNAEKLWMDLNKEFDNAFSLGHRR